MARPASNPDGTGSAINRTDMDLNRLDVAVRAPRKRKARNRPPPHKELRDAEAGLEKRALGRHHPPGVILEPAGFDEEHWTSPHSDTGLWTLQLADAFGTRSQAVVTTFMSQLEHLCDKMAVWDEKAHQWRMDEFQFSAVLALVSSIRPENEMQAMLAAQMVAVHLMQMKVSARALRYDGEVQSAAVAAKLSRAFAEQLRTMQEIKGKRRSHASRQTITVKKETHQHVHYHDNRGGGEETGSQSHGRTGGVVDQCTPLPSPEPRGQVVPLSSHAGKAGVPKARGQGGRA